MEKPHRSDADLANYLRLTRQNGVMDEVTKFNAGMTLDNLFAVFSGDKETLTPDVTYVGNTYLEFHNLLVASLLAYKSALKALKKLPTPPTTWTKEIERVWSFALLLWRIAYSRILARHLDVLQPFLHEQNGDGESFAQTDNDIDSEFGDGNEEDEVKIMNGEKLSSVVKRWIRLQVQHFASLKVLTSISDKLSTHLEVSLLSVNPCATSEIISWEDTIKNLFDVAKPLDHERLQSAEHVIEVLKEKFRRLDAAKKCRGVVRKFLKGDPSHFGIHCEGVLASIHKFPDNVSFDESEGSSIKKNCILVCDFRLLRVNYAL
jgi:hypothetical protein